ncbi:hypothetical protein DFH27DRAFT_2573 [Peziza echinospora]|nr:hypothetical protein DFH27DRAFT_2573 [Peziza echinospora]
MDAPVFLLVCELALPLPLPAQHAPPALCVSGISIVHTADMRPLAQRRELHGTRLLVDVLVRAEALGHRHLRLITRAAQSRAAIQPAQPSLAPSPAQPADSKLAAALSTVRSRLPFSQHRAGPWRPLGSFLSGAAQRHREKRSVVLSRATAKDTRHQLERRSKAKGMPRTADSSLHIPHRQASRRPHKLRLGLFDTSVR